MSSETAPKKTMKNIIIFLSITVLSLTAGFWVSQLVFNSNKDTQTPKNLDATVLPQARSLVGFNLIDHNGNAFGPVQLQGKWSFLFFGFTNCPDVCPTTLKIMQSVWKNLPTKMGNLGHPELYFVSVDPDWDKIEILKKYVKYFNSEFNAITGKLDELDKLTSQIGILYGYDEKDGDNDKEYIVNHSAQIILVDPKGRMRAVISPPHNAKTIGQNFQTIRNFYGDK